MQSTSRCTPSQLPAGGRTPLLYRWVRHPLHVGWMVFSWAAPTMTVGRLLFAGARTAYMLIAARFEERDLVGVYGEKYTAYRRQVPGFIPRLAGNGALTPATRAASGAGFVRSNCD